MIGSAVKANQVFLPVLENASKAQKLRTTLSVFERSKFFFSLPGTIVECIGAVRFLFGFHQVARVLRVCYTGKIRGCPPKLQQGQVFARIEAGPDNICRIWRREISHLGGVAATTNLEKSLVECRECRGGNEVTPVIQTAGTKSKCRRAGKNYRVRIFPEMKLIPD